MSLGKNILKLRKNNGLSQEQLGDKINVSRQTISNWEIGETSPNSEQLKILSKELKVSIDELLDNDYSADFRKEKSILEETASKEYKQEETTSKEYKQEETQKKLNTWQKVLLILGSPLWFALLIAVISIIASMYIVLWAITISFWAIFVSIVSTALSMILVGIGFAFTNIKLAGIAMISIGIFCTGLSILLFFACKSVTKAILWLTKESIKWIKNHFLKREVMQ